MNKLEQFIKDFWKLEYKITHSAFSKEMDRFNIWDGVFKEGCSTLRLWSITKPYTIINYDYLASLNLDDYKRYNKSDIFLDYMQRRLEKGEELYEQA